MPYDLDRVHITFEDGTFFIVECTENIQPQHNSTITDHKVEEGSRVADHITNEPITLSLTSSQSDIEGQTGIFDPEFQGKHIELDKRLFSAWDKKELLYVDAHIRGVYANYAIQNYSPITVAGQGRALDFTLQLKQISYAEAKKRVLQRRGDNSTVTNGKAINLGLKTPRAVTPRIDEMARRVTADRGTASAAAVFQGG